MKIAIREAQLTDIETILFFINELAIYEKAEHEVRATAEKIEQTMFSEHSGVYGLIAEANGQSIGLSIYFYNYSTWLAKPGLYLEDLYISPKYRGKGAGIAMLQHLANIAVNKGCGRFEWSCLDWNTPARDFYESLGAKAQNEWIGYRMSGKTLIELANKSKHT